MNSSATGRNPAVAKNANKRGRWLRTALTWHWVSSALALTGMLMFALTGITLNHAGQITASPEITSEQMVLPAEVTAALVAAVDNAPAKLPAVFSQWLEQQRLAIDGGEPEWSEAELYVAQTLAGGDRWLAVELPSGLFTYESTDRGWIAYFNDLHKGRNTGLAWSWFIDLFAVVCLIFCLTGFVVLWLHSRERIAVWPITGMGLVMPVLLALLFIH